VVDPGIADVAELLAGLHPHDSLPEDERSALAARLRPVAVGAGERIYGAGERLKGLYLIADGRVEVCDPTGAMLSLLGRGECFGERGLLRDGDAVTTATAREPTLLYLLPAADFHELLGGGTAFGRIFGRARPAEPTRPALTTLPVAELMTPDPLCCRPDATILEVARLMRDRNVSSLLVAEDDRLVGIVTARDLTMRALAEALPGDTPVRRIMTPDPVALESRAIGADVLHVMLERGIDRLPVVEHGRAVGILTQTDLTRHLAITSEAVMLEIVDGADIDALVRAVGRIPELLAHLVGAGNRHDVVTRLITDIADAATRRLLALAEAELGPPPVPYLWLACGSQGRREQAGVSDQDNCLFLDEAATDADDDYFAALAEVVCGGLAACGYVRCPGDMMATNPRWRQPVTVWRRYFEGWVRRPDPMAQMLASVMFDLRPIGGDQTLFSDLHARTLADASANSIFVAHMAANALKHPPPLSLFGGFSTARSGEHRGRIDLKHAGVVPIVDLARIYALQGRVETVGTRARLQAAEQTRTISAAGARDLIDAYDLIAETRLRHQAAQVRAGRTPDNFMDPGTLSDLERNHLRDAFVVVRTMQSAIGHGRSALT